MLIHTVLPQFQYFKALCNISPFKSEVPEILVLFQHVKCVNADAVFDRCC